MTDVMSCRDIRRGIDDERVRSGIGPDADAFACSARCTLAPARSGELCLEAACERLGVRVIEIPNACVAAIFVRRVEMRDERAVAESVVHVSADETRC